MCFVINNTDMFADNLPHKVSIASLYQQKSTVQYLSHISTSSGMTDYMLELSRYEHFLQAMQNIGDKHD